MSKEHTDDWAWEDFLPQPIPADFTCRFAKDKAELLAKGLTRLKEQVGEDGKELVEGLQWHVEHLLEVLNFKIEGH